MKYLFACEDSLTEYDAQENKRKQLSLVYLNYVYCRGHVWTTAFLYRFIRKKFRRLRLLSGSARRSACALKNCWCWLILSLEVRNSHIYFKILPLDYSRLNNDFRMDIKRNWLPLIHVEPGKHSILRTCNQPEEGDDRDWNHDWILRVK